MSGSWLAIVQGFAGMRVDDQGLSLRPFCPDGWDGYSFTVGIRGSVVGVRVTRGGTELSLIDGVPLTVRVDGEPVEVGPLEASVC